MLAEKYFIKEVLSSPVFRHTQDWNWLYFFSHSPPVFAEWNELERIDLCIIFYVSCKLRDYVSS